LIFPRNFALLPLARRPYGALSPSVLLVTTASCRLSPPAPPRQPTGRSRAHTAMRHPQRPLAAQWHLKAGDSFASLLERATPPAASQHEVPRDLRTDPTACNAQRTRTALVLRAPVLLLRRRSSLGHKRMGAQIPSNPAHLLLFLSRQPRRIEYRQWVPGKQSRLSTLNLRQVGPLFLS
jgi:hypothetical protein